MNMSLFFALPEIMRRECINKRAAKKILNSIQAVFRPNDVYMLILNVNFCANLKPTNYELFRKVWYLANVVETFLILLSNQKMPRALTSTSEYGQAWPIRIRHVAWSCCLAT